MTIIFSHFHNLHLYFIFAAVKLFAFLYFFNNLGGDDWRVSLAGNLSASGLSFNSDRLPSHAESVASAFIRAEKLKDGSFHRLDSRISRDRENPSYRRSSTRGSKALGAS